MAKFGEVYSVEGGKVRVMFIGRAGETQAIQLGDGFTALEGDPIGVVVWTAPTLHRDLAHWYRTGWTCTFDLPAPSNRLSKYLGDAG